MSGKFETMGRWHQQFQRQFRMWDLLAENGGKFAHFTTNKVLLIAWTVRDTVFLQSLDDQSRAKIFLFKFRICWIIIRNSVCSLIAFSSLHSERPERRLLGADCSHNSRATAVSPNKNKPVAENKSEPFQTTFQTFSDKNRFSQTMTTNQQ